MAKVSFALIVVFSFLGIAFAQDLAPVSSAPASEASHFAPGATLRVELEKTLDAKKAKAGDPVQARTTQPLMSGSTEVAPKGAKVFGHVVAATAHQGDSPSTLEIAFDKMQLGRGSDIPLKAVIQALGRPESDVNTELNQPMGSSGYPSTAPSMGGRSGGPGGSTGSGTPKAGSMGGSSVPSINPGNGELPNNAQGVIGISGISLSAGPAQDSVITASRHNVKLDGGTQMILRAQ